MRFFLLLIWLIFKFSEIANACPNCFAETEKTVLITYYFSAIFLSALPIAMIVGIALWLKNKI